MTTVLRDAGYVDGQLTSIAAPIWLGDSSDEAWPFVSEMGLVRGLTGGLDDATRARTMAELRRRIEASETSDLLGSAAWLITAHRP